MNSIKPETAWLSLFIGAEVISASALFHFFEGEKDNNPQEIELFFPNGSIRFYGSGDGASTCFSPVSLCECDLGEYGRLEIHPVSNQGVFSNLVGEKLVSISFVKSLDVEIVVGAVLSFFGSASLSILNIDDELLVFDFVPVEVVKIERLYVDEINSLQGEI